MENPFAQGGTVAVIVIGLTQVLKGFLPEKYKPLLPPVIGLLVGLLFELSVQGAVQGLIAGLVATGVYDAGKVAVVK